MQIEPPTGWAEILISGKTVIVTGLEYTSSQPLRLLYTKTLYCVVVDSGPAIYVEAVALEIAVQILPLKISH